MVAVCTDNRSTRIAGDHAVPIRHIVLVNITTQNRDVRGHIALRKVGFTARKSAVDLDAIDKPVKSTDSTAARQVLTSR